MIAQAHEAGELMTFAIDLIKAAGSLALSLQEQARATRKPDRTLVTQADFEVQSLVRKAISARFPSHQFLGEEDEGMDSLVAGQVPGALWILDPVDGTDSYLRRIPTWSICLGLAIEGEPVLGVVSIPSTGDLFYAEAGGPAYRNGQPIQVNLEETIRADSVLLVPSQMHLAVEIGFRGKLRAYGSTAAHLCYVATGAADAAVFANAGPWDIFGAGIVLEAAGGGLFMLDGTRLNLGALARERARSPVLVAGNPAFAGAVYRTLRLKGE